MPLGSTFSQEGSVMCIFAPVTLYVVPQYLKEEAALPLFLCMLIIWGAEMYNLGEFLAISLGWIV